MTRARFVLAVLFLIAATVPASAAAPEQLARRRTERLERLRAAAAAFEDKLITNSEALRGSRDEWHELVAWSTWGEALAAGGEPDEAKLQRIARQFFGSHPGLVDPTVGELRTALVAYLDLLEAARVAGEDYDGMRAQCIAELEAAAGSDADGASATAGAPLDFDALESAAWWLAAVGEAPELVARVQSRYGGPVIVGHVRRELVELKIAEIGQETEEVRQNRNRVQDAIIRGESKVRSKFAASLTEQDGEPRMRITLTGTIDAPANRSSSGQVKVLSESHSTFAGEAAVYWDGARFTATEPQVEAETHSTIHKIDAPNTIRYAAEKRIRENHASMEQSVAELIERQIGARMQERLAGAVERYNAKTEGFFAWLERSGITAEKWSPRVTAGAVELGYRPHGAAGIGSPPGAIAPLTGAQIAGLSFHDGAIESILGPQLAGAEWRDTEFSKVQRELTGGLAESMMIGLAPPRWGVVWSWRQPIRIRFTPAGATLLYRFQRVDVGGQSYDVPCQVRIELAVGTSAFGTELRRRSAAVVEEVDPERPVPAEVEELLTQRFARPLDEPYYLLGLQFPAGGELDALAGFQAVDAQLADGWIHVKYGHRGSTSQPTLDATASK